MIITMLGNFLVPYCSESQYRLELESLGHEVAAMQETQATTDEVLSQALRSDMFVWVHSHGFQNLGVKSMSDVLERLKQAGIPSVAYHLDLYYPIERWKEYESGEYFKIDHFFTVDSKMADWFNEKTTTKGHYLPAGAFSGQCYTAEYDPVYASGVGFTGAKGYHKEWPYRAKIIDWLHDTYEDKFTHWGPDGKELVREEKFNKVCASTKVMIGDSLCIGFNYPSYWSERVYNIVGAAGFIIHPEIPGLEREFKYGEEIETYKFGDFKGLQEKIDYYLTHPKERDKIRFAGQQRTIKDHTYRHRWQTILETVGIA